MLTPMIPLKAGTLLDAPDSTVYLRAATITLSCTTAGATILYTTDGSKPVEPAASNNADNASSTQTYTGTPFQLDTEGAATITAVAIAPSYHRSEHQLP